LQTLVAANDAEILFCCHILLRLPSGRNKSTWKLYEQWH